MMAFTTPTSVDPAIADRIEYINNRWPHLAPEQQLALAKSYASDDAVDELGQMMGQNIADAAMRQVGGPLPEVGKVLRGIVAVGSFSKKAVGAALRNTLGRLPYVSDLSSTIGDFLSEHFVDPWIKPATRYGFAALDAIPETVNNIGALITKTDEFDSAPSNRTFKGFVDSLSIKTLIDAPEDAGSGFIISQHLREEQAKRARAFRGEIYGSAYTIGRGAASVFYKENSEGYRRVSGFVDAFINLALVDPTKWVKKGVTAARGASVLTDIKTPLLTLNEAEELRALFKAEGGLTESLAGASLNVQKFNTFMDRNWAARSMVNRLVAEDDPLKIAEDMFKWDISNDTALQLAQATTPEQVKSALTGVWSISGDAAPGDLATYSRYSRRRAVLERTVPFIKNSRAMRKVPGTQVAVLGTSAERSQAARNMINSLRAAGATTDEVKELAPEIMSAFTRGKASDDVKAVHTAYRKSLKLILRKNGVNEDVISSVVDGGYERLASLRSYMIDRAGRETDFGFQRALLDQFADYVPDEFKAKLAEMASDVTSSGYMTIDRPLQMVELLDKVIILPDARELRRLTRNPLMRELLQSKAAKTILNREAIGTVEPALKKGAFGNVLGTGKVRRMEVDYVPADKQGEYKGLMEEIERIKSSAGDNPLTPKDIDDIAELEIRADNLKTAVRKEWTVTEEQRAVYEIIEQFQNKIWKAATLATGGYVVRNAMDAQIRMHFGAETGIFHPFDYVMLLAGNTKRRSIMGADITGGGFKLDDTVLGQLREEHLEYLTGAASRQLLDPTDPYNHLLGTGQWSNVTRAQGSALHTQGMVQNLRQIHKDPLQVIIARSSMLGLSEEETFNLFKYTATANSKIFNELKATARMGFTFVNSKGKKVTIPSIDLGDLPPAKLDEYMRMLYDTYITGNVRNVTGGVSDLEFMAAFNRVPKMDERRFVDQAMVKSTRKDADWGIGEEVKLEDGTRAIALGRQGDMVDVVPIFQGDALGGLMGSRNATRKIRDIPVRDEVRGVQGVPEYVRREVMIADRRDQQFFARTQRTLDRATDAFFGTFYDKKFVRYFERSPVYRQFYYEGVSKVINRVKPESADGVLKTLLKGAKKEGKSVDEYIGDKSVADAIINAADRATDVKVGANMRDIDDYARAYALARAKELLYNATERNNLVDIGRVILPFANAWREVLGTYMTQFADDAFRLVRSTQRVYTGLKNADPDQDGRGFFYNDPRTGDLMFTFPFSDNVMRFAMKQAGIEGGPKSVTMEAPVKQLSQGLNVLPALGPMAQFAAGSVMPNDADWQEIRKVLLPYGEKGATSVFNPVPGWMQKLQQAWEGDINATGTIFANTYIEAARARMAMGGYDIENDNDLERLKQDARKDAQVITAMRGFSQFLGPTSGRAEFTVETERGDAIVGEVLKFFQDLQQQDYDTSVQRFLSVMGDDMQLYVGSKARSLRNGLEASEEFGLWQLDNEDLLRGKYKNVASYFAPAGSEMNFDVYNSQINKGFRERLTFDELVAVAQQRIGSALYADARRAMGPYRTERQSDILRSYRRVLHEKYPGFPLFVTFTTNELENQIQSLGELADTDRMSGNELTADLKAYLAARDQVRVMTGATTTLSGKKRLQYRQMLHAYGEQLAQKNPYFNRVWNRVLVQEVDE